MDPESVLDKQSQMLKEGQRLRHRSRSGNEELLFMLNFTGVKKSESERNYITVEYKVGIYASEEEKASCGYNTIPIGLTYEYVILNLVVFNS